MKKYLTLNIIIVVIAISIITAIISTQPLTRYSAEELVTDFIKGPPERSLEELYQDLFLTLLNPYIDTALSNYYGEHKQYDLWSVDILDIDRPKGYRTFKFIVKLSVTTYVGAHNRTGENILTFEINSDGSIKFLDFQ